MNSCKDSNLLDTIPLKCLFALNFDPASLLATGRRWWGLTAVSPSNWTSWIWSGIWHALSLDAAVVFVNQHHAKVNRIAWFFCFLMQSCHSDWKGFPGFVCSWYPENYSCYWMLNWESNFSETVTLFRFSIYLPASCVFVGFGGRGVGRVCGVCVWCLIIFFRWGFKTVTKIEKRNYLWTLIGHRY